MNKAQFKKLYSQYRQDQRDFEAYMSRRNFPCGTDDFYYEQHEQSVQEWLAKHPALKCVIDSIYDTDLLEWRFENFNAWGSRPKSLKMELQRKYKQVA